MRFPGNVVMLYLLSELKLNETEWRIIDKTVIVEFEMLSYMRKIDFMLFVAHFISAINKSFLV